MIPTTTELLERARALAEQGLQQAQAFGAELWPQLLVPPFAIVAPVVLFFLVLTGYEARIDDGERFRLMRGRWFTAAALLLALGLGGLAWSLWTGGDPEIYPFLFDVGIAARAALWAVPVLFAAGLGFALGGVFGRNRRPFRNGRSVVIAIDGPAASGKGTLARRIADHYRLPCLDTGLLYRAVARDVQAAGHSLDDLPAAVAAAQALNPKSLEDEDLRTTEAGEAASVVAKYPEVRAALLDYQRSFAKDNKGGAVLDGRDIGTVVCPDADVKIYVTATAEERAIRRQKELQARGATTTSEEVLEDIRKRDSRDVGRAVSPLWPAKDAIHLDTTKLDPDQAFRAALAIIKERMTVQRVAAGG